MPNTNSLYQILVDGFPKDRTMPVLDDGAGVTLSFADLEQGAGRMASLLTDLGVTKGDRVAVQVEKSAAALWLYLGVLRIGAVYLPLNTAYTDAELAYFLSDAEPVVMVCRPASLTAMDALAAKTGTRHVLTLGSDGTGTLIDRSANCAPDGPVTPCGPDDLAAILYTSGTTGRSKGAMLTQANLISNAETLVAAWGFTDRDVLLHALPIYHAHGLFVAIHCVLIAGARMIFLAKFDADQVVSLLPQATTMMGVPTFYTRLLGHDDFTREACQGMRLFISGSAPLLAETHEGFEARTGHAILERYGMTETVMNTSNPLSGARIPGMVGPPLPGVEIRVVGDDGTVLPNGEIGSIEVRGPNVFSGYWRMPEKTAAEFRDDGFFITGDVGLIDADNGYVQIVGRSKDLIITGGLNVYPKEVETVIDAVPGVVESAVIGVPHADFGEGVVAIVVPEAGVDQSPATIEAACQDLAKFKRPKRIVFVDALPRNTMGKVQKAALRDIYRTSFDA